MREEKIIVRIILDGLFLAVILFGPWWLFLVFGLVGAFFFSYFYEFIFIGILIDALYGAGAFPFKATFFAVLVFVGVFMFKKLLRKDTI